MKRILLVILSPLLWSCNQGKSLSADSPKQICSAILDRAEFHARQLDSIRNHTKNEDGITFKLFKDDLTTFGKFFEQVDVKDPESATLLARFNKIGTDQILKNNPSKSDIEHVNKILKK